jgi:peptide/nickel transport system substrate-binding protein
MISRAASIAILAALLASCTGGEDEGAFAISVVGGKAHLADPNKGNLDVAAGVLAGALTQGLVAFDGAGQIDPALAESWVVTDDGLSYIFRIQRAQWSDGRPVTAHEVAQSLNAALGRSSVNRLKPLFTGVTEIVAMTDWVVEIRLSTPQPLLLQLLAQPEMAILRGGRGTGPYRIHRRFPNSYVLRPALAPGQKSEEVDPEIMARAERRVRGEDTARAVARFRGKGAALVLGGTFDGLPLVQAADIAEAQFRRDPAPGMFGLVALRGSAIAGDIDVRRALAMAIDRQQLLNRFGLNGWEPLETMLLGPIEGVGTQAVPGWASLEREERVLRARAAIAAWKARNNADPVVRLGMPGGPGGRLLFSQIAADWRAIGVRTVRIDPAAAGDFRLIDNVAPYRGVRWYLGRFSCGQIALCSAKADEALEDARIAVDFDARAKAYAKADEALAEAQIFIPISTPVRWSLVATRLTGYAENGFAIHPINSLERP